MVQSGQANVAPANGDPHPTGPAAVGREWGVAVAIAVVVEGGGSGATRASPIAGRLMRAYFAQAGR